MEQYLPILLMMALAIAFAGLSFAASRVLSPRRPTPAKSAPYECGIVPDKEPPQRFPVRFYLVAMIFIIFDIEIIFLYPWAVVFRERPEFLLIEMITFAAVVFIAFIYLVRNGALDWGPAKRLQAQGRQAAGRTTESTVRRISTGTGEAA